MKLPDDDRHDRTARYYGDDALAVLQRSRVLVVGAGAVGNEIVKHLALVGVARILLVDPDVVTDSNLNRCVLFRPRHAAARTPKVVAVRECAAELGATTAIDARAERIEALPIDDWIDHDLTICGVDDDHARLYLNTQLLTAAAADGRSRLLIDGAMGADFTQLRVLELPDSACLVCGWTPALRDAVTAQHRHDACVDFVARSRSIFPAVATQTSLVCAQMAIEAIRILTGLPQRRQTGRWPAADGPAIGRLIRYDTATHAQSVASIMRNPRCVDPVCRDAGRAGRL
jgi:molybdopterin/thiamine biosynthesis adenylyltransferase